jgi:hypothetical protein
MSLYHDHDDRNHDAADHAPEAHDLEALEADAHDVEFELDDMSYVHEVKQSPEPSRADKRWAANAFNNPDVRPPSFADEVLMESELLRGDRGDAVGDFIANQLMCLHQLILWTKASNPAEFQERIDA